MSSFTVHCPQHLNITMVSGFKDALVAALERGGECHLNIGLVEKVDSTGMQLLIAFQCALRDQQGAVLLKGESQVFSDALDVLGLKDQFQFKPQ